MRPWIKYLPAKRDLRLPIDADFTAHSAAMGGYAADESVVTREEFFRKYLETYHAGRLTHYREFVLRHVARSSKTLSLACGRAALELWMLDQGFDVTCSDLAEPACAPEVRRLFPDWRFEALDILQQGSSRTFDAVLCLSLIYLFDDRQLATFFGNVARSLPPGGLLVLDSAGAPDNWLSYFVHDVWLQVEARLMSGYARLKGLEAGVVEKHHGYRRTDSEVLQAARRAGFVLVDRQDHAPLTDFRRSFLFNRFVRPDTTLERVFERIGKASPYIRMWCLRLEDGRAA